jgi:hypothetical protein
VEARAALERGEIDMVMERGAGQACVMSLVVHRNGCLVPGTLRGCATEELHHGSTGPAARSCDRAAAQYTAAQRHTCKTPERCVDGLWLWLRAVLEAKLRGLPGPHTGNKATRLARQLIRPLREPPRQSPGPTER